MNNGHFVDVQRQRRNLLNGLGTDLHQKRSLEWEGSRQLASTAPILSFLARALSDESMLIRKLRGDCKYWNAVNFEAIEFFSEENYSERSSPVHMDQQIVAVKFSEHRSMTLT